MHYNPSTNIEYVTHSEIRGAFPDVSMPLELTEAVIESLGVFPLIQATPEYDPITQGATKLAPTLRQDDTYEQAWAIYTLDPEAIQTNIDAAKAKLIDAATAKRWEIETGGMVLPGGVHVATGTDDQNRITSVIANAELAGVETVDFKAESGWVTLSLAEVQGIAGAIGGHVQACFSAERAHHEAIALLATAQEIAAYDINANWPSNGSEPT